MTLGINGRVLTQKGITGVQRYAHEVVKALKAQLKERCLLFLPPSSNKYLQHLWEHFFLYFQLKKTKVTCFLSPANLLPLFLPRKVKAVTVIHDLSYLYFPHAYSWSFKLYYRLLLPYILRRSDKIIAVSEQEKLELIAFCPAIKDKVIAIPNGLNHEDFYEESIAQREPLILYVGSLSQRKNFYGALHAFSLVAKEIPHRFVVIGAASEIFQTDARVQQLLQEIPQERVQFLGQMNDPAKLRHWYSRASCLLFPSFYESSGLPPSEAMACGCPVIVSQIPALQERCEEAALYCNPHNVASIADALLQLARTPSLQEHLREAGKKQALKFSWVKTASELLKVCE